MQQLLLVMAGGAIGTGARYLVGQSFGRATLGAFGPAWPWGTMTVNLLGGLLMGLLVGTVTRTGASDAWRVVLGVGVLGGFTTFSAFSLDAVSMIERGALASALAYVAVSVIGSIAALGVGLTLSRSVAA